MAQTVETQHGYGSMPSQRLLLLSNPAEAKVVSTFRAGVVNNNAKVAKYDYVPSALAPPRISNESVIGEVPSSTFGGLEVNGQYGKAIVVEHNSIPAGYIAAVATGGPDSANNVIGIREHEQPEWRGLRLIPGLRPGFPLTDSDFMRSFGVGIRHRSAACIMQVKASGSYDIPSF